MSDRINTEDLVRELAESADLDAFLQDHEEELSAPIFPKYIRELCSRRGQVRERVILAAGIDRTYGHQLFHVGNAKAVGQSLHLIRTYLKASGSIATYANAAIVLELYQQLSAAMCTIILWCKFHHIVLIVITYGLRRGIHSHCQQQ